MYLKLRCMRPPSSTISNIVKDKLHMDYWKDTVGEYEKYENCILHQSAENLP